MTTVLSSRKSSLPRTRRLLSLGILFLVVCVGVSTFYALVYSSKPTRATSSFIFTAAGDYGQTSNTTAVLSYIPGSGASFNLGLGDLNYDYPTVTAQQWASNALSELGSNTFPFEF